MVFYRSPSPEKTEDSAEKQTTAERVHTYAEKKERIETHSHEELDRLDDEVDTKRQESASEKVEQAAASAGSFEKLLEGIALLAEQFGKLTDDVLSKFGLKTEDLDKFMPKEEETAEKSAPSSEKFETVKKYAQEYSQGFGVPAWSVLAILRQETLNFNSHASSPFTSAKGLAQATNETWREFLLAPDNKKFRQDVWTNPETGQEEDSRFNPEASVYFTAWYINRLAIQVNRKIDQKGLIEGYLPEWNLVRGEKIEADDMKNIALAYHSGAEGYLRWRRFQETGRGGDKLFAWQKRKSATVNGKRWKSYEEESENYRERVTAFAKEYQQLPS